MAESTYLRAVIRMADDSELPVIIGLCDRMAAREHYGKGLAKTQEEDPELAEEWLAYAAYAAAKRTKAVTGTWESFVGRYIGLDILEDNDPGPKPA